MKTFFLNKKTKSNKLLLFFKQNLVNRQNFGEDYQFEEKKKQFI